ncbi:MAG: hypothetical protein ABIH49_00345 [archaeon]
MKNYKKYLKETARDLVALGGIPFFVLVLARISILSKPEYLTQIAIAGAVYLIAIFIIKANIHSGLGLVVLIFTSLYYKNLTFTIFASAIYILMIASLFYFKAEKKKIIFGIIIGILSAGISDYIVSLIF